MAKIKKDDFEYKQSLEQILNVIKVRIKTAIELFGSKSEKAEAVESQEEIQNLFHDLKQSKINTHKNQLEKVWKVGLSFFSLFTYSFFVFSKNFEDFYFLSQKLNLK